MAPGENGSVRAMRYFLTQGDKSATVFFLRLTLVTFGFVFLLFFLADGFVIFRT
jgi:hypothetical protein